MIENLEDCNEKNESTFSPQVFNQAAYLACWLFVF